MKHQLFSVGGAVAGLLLLAGCQQSRQASIMEKHANMLTQPYGYVACHTTQTPVVDGLLDEADWQAAPWTEPFCDISGEGHPVPRYKTQAKMLWDDDNLYVAAKMEEPNVWGILHQRDTIIYHDPDFEVFIDPDDDGHNYFEMETNVLGTVFDLFLEQPYRTPHRGFVTFAFDLPGLKVATHVDGTLNNPNDTDEGWTVEIAIPRKAIAAEWDNYLTAGNYLRLGMSRVEWQTKVDTDGTIQRLRDADDKLLPEDNWTWGPTGMVAMHMPERWGYVYLSDKAPGTADAFQYPASYATEHLLWAMFYEQEACHNESGKYLNSLTDFPLADGDIPTGTSLKVEATDGAYEITATDGDGHATTINHMGQIIRKNKQ